MSATTIAQAIKALPIDIHEVYYCGGGQHNTTLIKNLNQLTNCYSASTEALGIQHDWVEALAFAWFAKNTIERKPSNLTSVTAASKQTILGATYFA